MTNCLLLMCQTETCTAKLHGHKSAVKSLMLINDSKLVSGDANGVIRTWDLTTFECLGECHLHNMAISSFCLIDNTFYSTSFDTTVRCWDIEVCSEYNYAMLNLV